LVFFTVAQVEFNRVQFLVPALTDIDLPLNRR